MRRSTKAKTGRAKRRPAPSTELKHDLFSFEIPVSVGEVAPQRSAQVEKGANDAKEKTLIVLEGSIAHSVTQCVGMGDQCHKIVRREPSTNQSMKPPKIAVKKRRTVKKNTYPKTTIVLHTSMGVKPELRVGSLVKVARGLHAGHVGRIQCQRECRFLLLYLIEESRYICVTIGDVRRHGWSYPRIQDRPETTKAVAPGRGRKFALSTPAKKTLALKPAPRLKPLPNDRPRDSEVASRGQESSQRLRRSASLKRPRDAASESKAAQPKQDLRSHIYPQSLVREKGGSESSQRACATQPRPQTSSPVHTVVPPPPALPRPSATSTTNKPFAPHPIWTDPRGIQHPHTGLFPEYDTGSDLFSGLPEPNPRNVILSHCKFDVLISPQLHIDTTSGSQNKWFLEFLSIYASYFRLVDDRPKRYKLCHTLVKYSRMVFSTRFLVLKGMIGGTSIPGWAELFDIDAAEACFDALKRQVGEAM